MTTLSTQSEDDKLKEEVIKELIEKGYMDSTVIAKKPNQKEIRYVLGELYAKDLLNTNVITKTPEGIWFEKLYRIYFTNEAFRKLYGGVKSRYDNR